MRVGLITPGSVADAAWNSARIRVSTGSTTRSALPVSHVEARTPAEQDEALGAYAAQGYALVFAHGFEFQDAGGTGIRRVSQPPSSSSPPDAGSTAMWRP